MQRKCGRREFLASVGIAAVVPGKPKLSTTSWEATVDSDVAQEGLEDISTILKDFYSRRIAERLEGMIGHGQ